MSSWNLLQSIHTSSKEPTAADLFEMDRAAMTDDQIAGLADYMRELIKDSLAATPEEAARDALEDVPGFDLATQNS